MSEIEEAAINNRSLRSRKHNRLENSLDDVENLKRPRQTDELFEEDSGESEKSEKKPISKKNKNRKPGGKDKKSQGKKSLKAFKNKDSNDDTDYVEGS